MEFHKSQLNKLNNGELYSYIDIKSLEINGIEQINLDNQLFFVKNLD